MCLTFPPYVFCNEEDIHLDKVPAVVLKAAVQARPGITLTSTELVTDNSKTLYELEGVLNNSEVEVLLAADGTVISIDDDD